MPAAPANPFPGRSRWNPPLSRAAAGFLLALVLTPQVQGIGMRHDVPESRYLALAVNAPPFEVGLYPDFSSVCAVGKVRPNGDFEVIGSGVLLSPEWVLTAAHVVLSVDPSQSEFEPNLRVRFGPSLQREFAEFRVMGVSVPIPVSQLRPLQGRASREAETAVVQAEFHDLALIHLENPAESVPPAPWHPHEDPLLGQLICFAGYGDAATGNDTRERSWTAPDLRRAAMNVVDRDVLVNPLTGDPKGGILLFDFDNGQERRNSLNTRSRAWEPIFGEGRSSPVPVALEGASYPGDSGGPAFARIDGEWKVVAVSGYGTGYPPGRRRSSIQYGDILVFTRIADHAEWIQRTVGTGDALAEAPPPEGVPIAEVTPIAEVSPVEPMPMPEPGTGPLPGPMPELMPIPEPMPEPMPGEEEL